LLIEIVVHVISPLIFDLQHNNTGGIYGILQHLAGGLDISRSQVVLPAEFRNESCYIGGEFGSCGV